MITVNATLAIADKVRTADLTVPVTFQPATKKLSASVTRTAKESEPETGPASLMALMVRVAMNSVGR